MSHETIYKSLFIQARDVLKKELMPHLRTARSGSHIATLVERHTRYVMFAKVDGKDTATVIEALIKKARKLPPDLYKTLTWNRGKTLEVLEALIYDCIYTNKGIFSIP